MKLFLVLLGFLIYDCCIGYPAEGEISEDIMHENATAIDHWSEFSNRTAASNDSLPREMQGFAKKVGGKIKVGIKTVKNKVTGVINKVKGGFKDNGGSGGKTIGGHYRHHRVTSTNGGGSIHPSFKWVLIGLAAFAVVIATIVIVVYALNSRKIKNFKN